MEMKGFSPDAIDWSAVPAEEQPGEAGTALLRVAKAGDARVRMIEYSPEYLADHWCSKGHIILVLEGELVLERRDGASARLGRGMGYHVADGDAPHRARTETGAKVFIVD